MTTEPFTLDEAVTTKPEHIAARSRFADLPVHLALLVIGLAIATPIIISFFISFTPLRELVSRADPSIIPDTWTLDNYEKAWNATPFGRFVLNSFIQTGIITGAQVLLSILAGYAFAMFEFRFKNTLFAILIGSLIIPFELTFIPNFLLISDLGWANPYAGLTVPFLASAFGVFMICQALCTLVFGPLADKFSVRGVLVVCYFIPVLATSLLVPGESVPLAYAFAVSAGLAAGGRSAIFPVGLVYAFGETHMASIFGFSNTLFMLGNAFGAPIASAIYERTGSTEYVYVFCASVLVVSTILVSLTRPERKPDSEATV